MVRWILFSLVSLGFLAVTGVALYEFGYVGLFEQGLLNAGTLQILLDLFIACGFGLLWVHRDARERGLNPWPWIVLTVPLGSISLLGYTVARSVLGGASSKPSGT